MRNDAKGALAACGSSSPVVRKTHTCRSPQRALYSWGGRALSQEIYATFGCSDVRTLASVHLVPADDEGDDASNQPFEEIFAGPVDGMDFREIMDLFVHAALEGALGAGQKGKVEKKKHPMMESCKYNRTGGDRLLWLWKRGGESKVILMMTNLT